MVLVYVTVVAMIMAGALTMTVSNLSRTATETNYACALYYAEAGVNYELNKISLDPYNSANSADLAPNGNTYTFGSGSYTVKCSVMNGTSAWVAPNNLTITATGTVNGVSRTIQVNAKGAYGASSSYGMFGIQSIIKTGASVLTGDVGTDGTINFTGSTNATGSFIFNGVGSGWSGTPVSGVTTVHNSSPVTWPTVDSIAAQKFPSGGLTWLAQSGNNDNARALPPIVNNTINQSNSFTLTLTGPGNYYVDSLTCNNVSNIVFNNLLGPVYLWIGPSNGTAVAKFNNTTIITEASTAAANHCVIYVATQGGISFTGQTSISGSIYAYNQPNSSTSIGQIIKTGAAIMSVNGIILANTINITGSTNITEAAGSPQIQTVTYYQAINPWTEQNSAF